LINRKIKLEKLKIGELEVIPMNTRNIIKLSYKLLSAIYKMGKIDVVSCQDPFYTAFVGSLAKYIFKIPLHIQNHSSFIDNKYWISENPVFFTFLNFLGKINLKLADRTRVVNSLERSIYVSKLKIKEDKIDLAPVPVDSRFFQEEIDENEITCFKNKFGLQANKIKIGWAGRFVPVKNIPFLFECLSNFKESEFEFLMAGDYKNSEINLEKLEINYRLKPVYLGLLNKEELRIFYKTIDIYLHTSVYEGFGLVVADAISAGVPVVSTSVAGSKDLIINEFNGFIAKDKEEFIHYTKQLIADKNKRQEISLNALSYSKAKFNVLDMEQTVVNSIMKTRDKKTKRK